MVQRTPTYGLPWVEPSDTPVTYPTISQELATDVEAAVKTYQARYYRGTAFTFPATGNQVVNPFIYTTKVFDTGNRYNTATGLYTCPVAGLYMVRASLSFTASAASQTLNCGINVNGTNDTIIFAYSTGAGAMHSQAVALVQCNAGDTISVQAACSLASGVLRASPAESALHIAYLGQA